MKNLLSIIIIMISVSSISATMFFIGKEIFNNTQSLAKESHTISSDNFEIFKTETTYKLPK